VAVRDLRLEISGYRHVGPVLIVAVAGGEYLLVNPAENHEEEVYHLGCWRASSGDRIWASEEVVGEWDIYALARVRVPDGRIVVGAATEDGGHHWDALSGNYLGGYQKAGVLRDVDGCVLPSGKAIFVGGSADGRIHRWDPLGGEGFPSWNAGEDSDVLSVAAGLLHNGETVIAAGDHMGIVRLWDALSGDRIGQDIQCQEAVRKLVLLSPSNGRTVLAAFDADGTLSRWDALSGEPIGELIREDASYTSVAGVEIDGIPFLIAASDDNVIRCWNAVTGESLATPWSGDSLSIVMSDDGRAHPVIAVGSDGGRITVSAPRIVDGSICSP
jgi:WD40 repeat protein